MTYQHVKVPVGEKITMGSDGRLMVPDNPVIPFIEGDGTGPDIWRAAVRVFEAAVRKAYAGKKKISWMEVYAGEKPFNMGLGWLPEETVEAYREFPSASRGL
jgi:isocitrate dehydrogenase